MPREVHTVTRKIYATSTERALLEETCRRVGDMRRDIWQKYGGLGTFGETTGSLRKTFPTEPYRKKGLDGTIANESAKDIFNDIYACRASAFVKIARAVYRRLLKEQVPVRELPGALKQRMKLLDSRAFLQDAFLHRTVRACFRHGRGHARNQFVVRSDKQTSFVRDGRLIIRIRMNGRNVELVTTTSGSKVNLAKRNLRIILTEEDRIEICYAFEKPAGRPHGEEELGLDKGYSEMGVDSRGRVYAADLGEIQTRYCETRARTGKARNRLHALARKHELKGHADKAERIRINNLGTVKQKRRNGRFADIIRDRCCKAVHALADHAAHVVTEDLTWRSRGSSNRGRRYNRRMSGWVKGRIAAALEILKQRGVQHSVVNAAYTSQMDSRTGRLEGELKGDSFYCVDGEVLQRDWNAARNILARYCDTEITRYMPKETVKRILEMRMAEEGVRSVSDVTEHQEAPVASALADINGVRIIENGPMANYG